MAEWVCRTLRDGGLEGEHAPALTINDTISCPLGSSVFEHVLSQLSSIFSQNSQSERITTQFRLMLWLCNCILFSLAVAFF
ncbi:hypothetical protein ACS0TY_014687 [Phlomoides rotata]